MADEKGREPGSTQPDPTQPSLAFFTRTNLTLWQHLISPYNVTPESHIKVVTIKVMIAYVTKEALDC